jgi:hypothetical protein
MVIEPPTASTAGSSTPEAARKAVTMSLLVDMHNHRYVITLSIVQTFTTINDF